MLRLPFNVTVRLFIVYGKYSTAIQPSTALIHRYNRDNITRDYVNLGVANWAFSGK